MADNHEEKACEATSPSTEPAVRWLTRDELDDLRRDMAESSAWMRAELRRRKARRSTDQQC